MILWYPQRRSGIHAPIAVCHQPANTRPAALTGLVPSSSILPMVFPTIHRRDFQSPRSCLRPARSMALFLALLFLGAVPSWARQPQSAEIRPWVLEHTSYGRSAELLVVLRDRADLAPAWLLRSRLARGRFVHDRLVDTSRRSQASLRSWLDRRGIAHRDFYIVNALLVRGDRRLVEELAHRPDVARIEGNPHVRVALPEPDPAASITSTRAAAGIEWNIQRTGAPQLWALGITGQGIVVGSQDTGVDWTHPAIKSRYRGWNGTAANHDFNWHDAIHANGGSCGNDSPVPCDAHGHGTHTVGTILGDDGAGNQIGMAPGARWIACRNMDGDGYGSPATYLECFQFFLAPYPVGGTPGQGNPDLAPDITNNSWTCPPEEGCSLDTLEAAVSAQRAAGILTVAAAGNSGPDCGSIHEPPAIYAATFTIGATDEADSLALFSSRGPATSHDAMPGLIKPGLVAPGVGVRSAVPGGGYLSFSGTSMASPNVAGGAALLWSAFPFLRGQPVATVQLLEATATRLDAIVESCGGDYVNGPNNSWGYGLMNLVAAYQAAREREEQPAARRPTARVTPKRGAVRPPTSARHLPEAH